MASLPSSFSYFVSSLGGVSRKSVKLTPNNSTTVSQNGQLTFTLPSDAICDLSTMQFIYDFKYQNAASGTNAVRYVPQPAALCRSIVWSISNQSVSGAQNQNWAQVFECLRRASTGPTNSVSRQDEYCDIPAATLLGASTSKVLGTGNERAASNTVSRKCKLTNFLGLQTASNAQNFDTGVVGETRVQIQLNGAECALIQADAGTVAADADWELQNCEMRLDVISFSSGEYDALMSAMLQEGELSIPFNEITSQKSLLNSSIRFNVASSSLDMLGFALLRSDHGSYTSITSATGCVDSDFGGLTPNNVKFQYRNGSSNTADTLANMSDSVDAQWYWLVNGAVMPSSGSTQLIQGSEYTKECYSNSKDDYNQLFLDYCTAPVPQASGSDQTETGYPSAVNVEFSKQYRRVNYLNQNAFTALRTCLDVPASQSDKRALSGINTLGGSSSIQLNLSGNWNNSTDYALLVGQGSSVLQVGMGQQVSVIA